MVRQNSMLRIFFTAILFSLMLSPCLQESLHLALIHDKKIEHFHDPDGRVHYHSHAEHHDHDHEPLSHTHSFDNCSDAAVFSASGKKFAARELVFFQSDFVKFDSEIFSTHKTRSMSIPRSPPGEQFSLFQITFKTHPNKAPPRSFS